MQFAICSAKWLVRIQEQLVPVNLLLLSAKWLVQIPGQLVPVNLLLLSAKRPVQIQEQLAPVNLSVFSVKLPVRAKRTTCTCQSCYFLSCGCLPIPQWIRLSYPIFWPLVFFFYSPFKLVLSSCFLQFLHFLFHGILSVLLNILHIYISACYLHALQTFYSSFLKLLSA